MSFLFGTQGLPGRDNKRLGLNDTSTASNEQGNPLPLLYGTRRFAGTFITDAFEQTTSSEGGGGKDAGKGGGGRGTNYYASFAVAFCLGPVDTLSDLFLNGDAVFTETNPLAPNTLSQLNNLATFYKPGHGLSTGQSVIITGCDQPEFNGEFVITVIDANNFTYIIPGSEMVAEVASGPIQCWIKLAPIQRGNEDFITITIPNYGIMTLYWGTETQPADPTLQLSGTAQSPMHGVCYAVFENFFLGLNQTNIQNVEVVLTRTPAPDWIAPGLNAIVDQASPGNVAEANPAAVIYDLVTNPRFAAFFTDADFNLPSFQAAAAVFVAESFGVSNIINRSDDALSVIQQILETTDSVLTLDANCLLLLQPIRAPASYVGLPQIADAQLAEIPTPTAADWSTTFNDTKITFPNNQAAWLNDFVEWFDFGANTAAQKVAQPQNLQRDWLTRRDLALLLVRYAGTLGALPAQTGKAKILFSVANWATLAPGYLFQLGWAGRPNATGFFRVTKRGIADPAQPVFDIEYAADRSYLYSI